MSNGDRAQTSAEETISRGVAALYAEYMDVEPEAVTTHLTEWASATTCRTSMTKAELVLAETGKGVTVRNARRMLQDAMRDDLVSLVEGEADQKAECFFSDHDPDADVAIEVVTFR